MKVIQFGLRFSPNLGDGIIADCIDFGVRALRPGAEVCRIDLSGREASGAVTVRNRSAVLRVLKVLPLFLRQAIVQWKLGRMLDEAAPRWAAIVQGADLALLGGGQLFADADLNFCLKVARAAEILQAAGVPLVVYGVGVSKGWTRRGAELFRAVLQADLRQVGVRDELSRMAWQAQMAGLGPEPVLTRDPGLLAAQCYGAATDAGGRVGLCITAPEILAYHADAGVGGTGGLAFYAGLARALCDTGERVMLFTNGAEEDRAALDRLCVLPEIEARIATGHVSIAAPAARPEDLARQIGGYRAVVAHRLHACIVAWSYGRPIVGLGWDRKVQSFFASVQADGFFSDAPDIGGAAVAAMVAAAIAAGVDATLHAEVLAETWAGLDGALGVLTARPAEA